MIKSHVYSVVWVVKDAHVAVGGYIQYDHAARKILEKDVHVGNISLKVHKQVAHISLGDLVCLVEMHRIKRQEEQSADNYRYEQNGYQNSYG